MFNAVKAAIFLQSYVGAFWLVFWIGDFTIFTPWWLKIGATALACIMFLVPIAWMIVDDEERKRSSRRDKRLDLLEREAGGYG